MNKEELISKVAKDLSFRIGHERIAEVLNKIIDNTISTLASGEEVRLVGFGRFEPHEVKARACAHPITGERVEIEPMMKVSFHPGKVMKKSVNAGYYAKGE